MRSHRRRAASGRSKRLFDLLLAAVLAPVVVPFLALVALAVRLDSPGPVFFTQERTGQHGRRFRMLKFRTMVRDAEALKEQLQHLNVLEPPDFKIPNDPRITRIGRFLRATSIDELPQFWNVVRGDMSFVGPRPTSFDASTYRLWQTRRLEGKPGITGAWQVGGRHHTGLDERVRLDDDYLRHRSTWRDLKIMATTLPALIRREGE
jgi:lipopolysaccharide/colanic/teichoic acid biosynthesis glycosyltransferase